MCVGKNKAQCALKGEALLSVRMDIEARGVGYGEQRILERALLAETLPAATPRLRWTQPGWEVSHATGKESGRHSRKRERLLRAHQYLPATSCPPLSRFSLHEVPRTVGHRGVHVGRA